MPRVSAYLYVLTAFVALTSSTAYACTNYRLDYVGDCFSKTCPSDASSSNISVCIDTTGCGTVVDTCDIPGSMYLTASNCASDESVSLSVGETTCDTWPGDLCTASSSCSSSSGYVGHCDDATYTCPGSAWCDNDPDGDGCYNYYGDCSGFGGGHCSAGEGMDTSSPTPRCVALPECVATVDGDGDGHDAERAGGDDCDDSDASIHPGATEVPYDGIDQDCDGQDLTDGDGDGYDAESVGGDDCDDDDADVNPGATEICDNIDDDCNGLADDDDPGVTGQSDWYRDDDDDAYGSSSSVSACDKPDGYASEPGDCDDTNADIHPDATEVCNGSDDDCDGAVDEGFDVDADAWTSCGGDCNDTRADIYPGAPEVEDDLDNDCDYRVDEGTSAYDDDGDGYTEDDGDCNDGNGATYVGAVEVIDAQDNDCDGLIDEGTSAYDDDGDGYSEDAGDCDDTLTSIHPGATETVDGRDDDCDYIVDEGTDVYDDDGDGYSEDGGDCDDTDGYVSPGAPEVLNGIDDDCDDVVDEGTEGFDDDGDGYTEIDGDCDDTSAATYPGAPETVDDRDNDCDGVVDEGTDVYDDDGDGYTEADGDCDDHDSEVYPGAFEANDGKDNDCDGVQPEDVGCTSTGSRSGSAIVALAGMFAVLWRGRRRPSLHWAVLVLLLCALPATALAADADGDGIDDDHDRCPALGIGAFGGQTGVVGSSTVTWLPEQEAVGRGLWGCPYAEIFGAALIGDTTIDYPAAGAAIQAATGPIQAIVAGGGYTLEVDGSEDTVGVDPRIITQFVAWTRHHVPDMTDEFVTRVEEAARAGRAESRARSVRDILLTRFPGVPVELGPGRILQPEGRRGVILYVRSVPAPAPLAAFPTTIVEPQATIIVQHDGPTPPPSVPVARFGATAGAVWSHDRVGAVAGLVGSRDWRLADVSWRPAIGVQLAVGVDVSAIDYWVEPYASTPALAWIDGSVRLFALSKVRPYLGVGVHEELAAGPYAEGELGVETPLGRSTLELAGVAGYSVRSLEDRFRVGGVVSLRLPIY